MHKNEEIVLNIIDNGFQGEGIAKFEDKTIFIPNAIKGEKVRAKILKVNKNIAFGKILEIIEKSEFRVPNDCEYYEKCGGCNLRHIEYQKTLEMKKISVQNTLKKELKREVLVDKVIGMEKPKFYRNKLVFPVSQSENNKTIMGIFAERSHRIIEVDKCQIQNEKCQKVAKDLLEFFNENNILGYSEEARTRAY